MLDFIPFLPSNAEGVENSLWKTALLSWNYNLASLLNMQDDSFLRETSLNKSLAQFIDQVLNEQMDNKNLIDAKLLEYIFLIYTRLDSLDATIPDNHLLLTADRLSRFIIVYSESNIDQVRSITSNLINRYEALENGMLETMNLLVNAIQSMPNLFSEPLSESMIIRAYVVVRILDTLLTSTVFVDVVRSSFDTLDEILITCYRDLIPIFAETIKEKGSLASSIYLVKKTFVSIFNTFADIHFFKPLGYISSHQDKSQLEKIMNGPVDDATIELMNSKILSYIAQSGLDTSRSAFFNAPLILDWEIEYDITKKLRMLSQTVSDDEDERIMILVIYMEQVRDSNDVTNSWKDVFEKQLSTTDSEDTEMIYKISQVQELFPDLGDGFIEACLKACNNDVELMITRLLNDTLPDTVRHLDRKMESKSLLPDAATAVAQLEEVESYNSSDPEEKSLLKTRRNKYDNDEFDIFSGRNLDTSKIYTGKKDKGTADALLGDKTFIETEKKNILKRVVDMYDDEYDDTYDDINDAGVPVSMDNADGDDAIDFIKRKQEIVDPGVTHESLLVHTFVDNPEVFDRNGATRKSAKRDELRKQTGMSNEQLEGWAIMFSRNPRKNKILDKYMLFDGNQIQVSSKTSQAQKDSQKKENKRPPLSQAKDRAHKGKNKAQIGNHNRKAMRDKKAAKVNLHQTD
ncbi:MAG: hypothetical protein EXX96DRAFT_628684 [Benjaminiella poitrasii]|nr:MAG: hypothetical protein EXX96DRAFT_628684 [Benjaminiella poitrasii]